MPDLVPLSAASSSTVAVQIIKGFRPRAERLEQDMGGFTVNRMKEECQDIVILNRKQVVPSTGYFHRPKAGKFSPVWHLALGCSTVVLGSVLCG